MSTCTALPHIRVVFLFVVRNFVDHAVRNPGAAGGVTDQLIIRSRRERAAATDRQGEQQQPARHHPQQGGGAPLRERSAHLYL